MPTSLRRSSTLSFSSFLVIFKWVLSDSPIWSPTVKTGLSELIGSWNIIDILFPRSARMSRSLERSMSAPSKIISPLPPGVG
jgi:hypothetical protein